MTVPGSEEIKEARQRAGLTQTQAAELVHAKLRTWQDWEAGVAKMHAGLWELFCIKTKKLAA
ncbi:helix-turn-helix domain-containing protein [Polaromonas sp.]|uniref:helix-turn-helix domain-containing protein n=1 Tax=Polaromonas sp. TaxID=1869339 RepID=UPI003BB55CC7